MKKKFSLIIRFFFIKRIQFFFFSLSDFLFLMDVIWSIALIKTFNVIHIKSVAAWTKSFDV